MMSLSNVSMYVAKGKIKAVIGPNGAGKTTLFNVISGALSPNKGEIIFEDKIINELPSYKRTQLGIGRTFQTVKLFKQMSVMENVMVGRHCRTKSEFFSSGFRLPKSKIEEKKIAERADAELDFVGAYETRSQAAGSLPIGLQKSVEVARALATDPKLLLLDEPAGGLNDKETAHFSELIKKIQEREITIILVEHDMKLVMNISDEIAVLNYGEKIAEGVPEIIKNDKRVIEAYLG
ncbi:MAG: ABC transporter ATP-binding protein [Epsilonproteobacteria bacterium]|nr:ABC transporter ATP-binding protein [Campylobacterota bacterium]